MGATVKADEQEVYGEGNVTESMLPRSPLSSLGMWGGVRELLTCSETLHMGVAGSMLLNSLGSQLWKGWISGVSHMPPTACAEAFQSGCIFFRVRGGGHKRS